MTQNRQIIRFLVAGALASGVHLAVLVLLTDFVGVWYVVATSVGFVAGFGVSFTLQKYWTFRNMSHVRVRTQAGLFLMLQVSNLAVNALLMFSLVEWAGVHYVVSQVFVLGLIAISTYLLSKRIFQSPIEYPVSA